MGAIRRPNVRTAGLAAALLVLALLAAVALVAHYWVYICNHPPINDLSREQRKVVLLSAIKNGRGLAALPPDGMTALPGDDVTEVTRSRCLPETEYTRKSSRRTIETCVDLSVNLYCAFEVRCKRGAIAAGLMSIGRGRYWPEIPNFGSGTPDIFYDMVTVVLPELMLAREKLCGAGY